MLELITTAQGKENAWIGLTGQPSPAQIKETDWASVTEKKWTSIDQFVYLGPILYVTNKLFFLDDQLKYHFYKNEFELEII